MRHLVLAILLAPTSAVGALPAGAERVAASEGSPSDLECFARRLCAVKEHIRWRTPAWDGETCLALATAIKDTAAKYFLDPSLILATLVNESELNENAVRVTYIGKKIHAKDGGLGGIRCILAKDAKTCVNSLVYGVTWKEVMVPTTNIGLTGKILAYYRDGGAITKKTVKVRRNGRLRAEYRIVPCIHKNHAWWSHYNHGPSYKDHGPARHYGHRVAVLYAALLRAGDASITDELRKPITIRDKGQSQRTIDKPIGKRQRHLVAEIMECSGICPKIAARAVEHKKLVALTP